jgi:hypothetical protein
MEANHMQSASITRLLFAEQSYISVKVSGIRLAVAFFCVRPDGGGGRILPLMS